MKIIAGLVTAAVFVPLLALGTVLAYQAVTFNMHVGVTEPIEVIPTHFLVDLGPGTTVEKTFFIHNTGSVPLTVLITSDVRGRDIDSTPEFITVNHTSEPFVIPANAGWEEPVSIEATNDITPGSYGIMFTVDRLP